MKKIIILLAVILMFGGCEKEIPNPELTESRKQEIQERNHRRRLTKMCSERGHVWEEVPWKRGGNFSYLVDEDNEAFILSFTEPMIKNRCRRCGDFKPTIPETTYVWKRETPPDKMFYHVTNFGVSICYEVVGDHLIPIRMVTEDGVWNLDPREGAYFKLKKEFNGTSTDTAESMLYYLNPDSLDLVDWSKK